MSLKRFERVKFMPAMGPIGVDPQKHPGEFGRAATVFFTNGHVLRLFHQAGEFGGSRGTLKTPPASALYEVSVNSIVNPETLGLGPIEAHEGLLGELCKKVGIDRPAATQSYERGIALRVPARKVDKLLAEVASLPSTTPIPASRLEAQVRIARRHRIPAQTIRM